MARIEEVLEKAVSDVWASTSQISSGSVALQEKLKLAFKLLGVSSRIFEYLSIDRVVYTDPLLNNLAGSVGAGG